MELFHDILEVTSNDSTSERNLYDGESADGSDIWVKNMSTIIYDERQKSQVTYTT